MKMVRAYSYEELLRLLTGHERSINVNYKELCELQRDIINSHMLGIISKSKLNLLLNKIDVILSDIRTKDTIYCLAVDSSKYDFNTLHKAIHHPRIMEIQKHGSLFGALLCDGNMDYFSTAVPYVDMSTVTHKVVSTGIADANTIGISFTLLKGKYTEDIINAYNNNKLVAVPRYLLNTNYLIAFDLQIVE